MDECERAEAACSPRPGQGALATRLPLLRLINYPQNALGRMQLPGLFNWRMCRSMITVITFIKSRGSGRNANGEQGDELPFLFHFPPPRPLSRCKMSL